MAPLDGATSNSILFPTARTRSLALAVMFGIVVLAALFILAAMGYQRAYASAPENAAVSQLPCGQFYPCDSPGVGADNPESASDFTTVSPVDPTLIRDLEGDVLPLPLPPAPGVAREVYVWASYLTVGESADSSAYFLGYAPGMSPDESSLASARFTYGDVEYSIRSLYYEERNERVKRLVLETDNPLPDRLTLYVGNHEFPFSDSRPFGPLGNALAWQLDQDLGLTPGQEIPVALLETYGSPMAGGKSPTMDSHLP